MLTIVQIFLILLTAVCSYNPCNHLNFLFMLYISFLFLSSVHTNGFFIPLFCSHILVFWILIFLSYYSEEKQCFWDMHGVEDVVRNMKPVERAVLGFKCKQIIDVGRMMWAKEHGLDTQLVKYVPSGISPENHLLLARHAKCL